VKILDKDGNTFGDSSAIATLKSATSPDSYTADPSVTIQNGGARAVSGVFTFSNVTIKATPGSTIYLYILIENFPENGNSYSFIDNPTIFSVDVGKCQSGQSYNADLTCTICPVGTYLFEAPSEVTPCKECPLHLICLGGNQTAVEDGYWRNNETDIYPILCPDMDKCK